MSTFLLKFFLSLNVISILSLLGINSIFKALENKGKKVDKHKKLATTIVCGSLATLMLAIGSYTLTRNNIDFLKSFFIYILFAVIFYSICRLYKQGHKRIAKFIVVPLTFLVSIFLLKVLSYLLIDTSFLFPIVISVGILITVAWLRCEIWEENSKKQRTFNRLYLALIIFFAIFSWTYLGKYISLLTPLCELKVIDYLESKGHYSNEYYSFPGSDLERGDRELIQVHFKDDPCTYVYEYFYYENVVRQIKIFKDKSVDAIHKEDGAEILE